MHNTNFPRTRGHNILLWHPRPRIFRILFLHETLGDQHKNSYPSTTHTQKFSCTLKLHRFQALKLPLALIAPIARAPKPSLVLEAPLLNHAHLLLSPCLVLASSHLTNLPHNSTLIPSCLSPLHKKPVPGYRNED